MLEPGLNEFEIYHPAVYTTVTVPWKHGCRETEEAVHNRIEPVSHREIYLIHHSHYDVAIRTGRKKLSASR
jgi:hypothetical protein